MLAPETRERFPSLGNAEILEVFNISKVGKVAGLPRYRVAMCAAVRRFASSVTMS